MNDKRREGFQKFQVFWWIEDIGRFKEDNIKNKKIYTQTSRAIKNLPLRGLKKQTIMTARKIKKTILVIVINLVSITMYSQEATFEGFKYGMDKDDVITLVEQKVEAGLLKPQLNNKRWLFVPSMKYYSDILKDSVYFQVRIMFEKKKLSRMFITVYKQSNFAWLGFKTVDEVNILNKEMSDRYNKIAWGSMLSHKKSLLTPNYYKPMGYVEINDKER